jgi:hypothetical protein
LDAPFGAPPPSAFARDGEILLLRGSEQNSDADAPRERFCLVIASAGEAINLWSAGFWIASRPVGIECLEGVEAAQHRLDIRGK